MAAATSICVKYCEDITECPICHNTFDDPRQLPCLPHTFCLKCIQGWIENIKPEEAAAGKLQCPICTAEFNIPEGVVTGLSRNCFIGKLVETKKLSEILLQPEVSCDVCSNDEEMMEVGLRKNAVAYCLKCRYNMCELCLKYHQKYCYHISRTHNVVELNKEISFGELVTQLPEARCENHADEKIRFYCFDCSTVVCPICLTPHHNGHRFSHLNEVAEELTTEVKTAREGLDGKAAECQKMIEKIAANVGHFVGDVEKIENEIIAKADEMKKMIEDHKSKLLGELDEAKAKHMKQLSCARQDVDARMLMIESFKRYLDELTSMGSVCDVARSAGSVRQRAKELMEYNVETQTPMSCVDIKFTYTGSVESPKQLFGQLVITEMLTSGVCSKLSSKPWKIIPSTGHEVTGITTLGDEVFVVSDNVKHIDVYDASTLTSTRQLPLPANATGQNRGIAACPLNKCVYVSDWTGERIHKISAKKVRRLRLPINNWSVGYEPYGISLNTDHNLLVSCWDFNRIHEYTSTGTPVRQITFQFKSTSTAHAIQLSNVRYGVTESSRYCVVDGNGQLVRCFGGNAGGFGDGQLSNPKNIVADRNHKVLIADSGNNRIMELDTSTFTAKPLAIELDGGLKCPFSLHFDSSRGRLYVGEWNGGRLIVLSSTQ